MRSLALTLSVAVLPLAAPASAATSVLTPYTLTNTTYAQNFNALATSGSSAALPAGFQISEVGTSMAADGLYTAGTGSSNAGDVYSFGVDADRALGSLYSGTNTPSFGFIFTNGLSSAITSLNFAFAGEQWRAAAGTADRLNFQYRVGASAIDVGTWVDVDGLDIVSQINGVTGAATLNGNLAANRMLYAATIGSLNIAAGQTFGFRFVDADGPGGADAGLALDDLRIDATAVAAVPEPATWGMMILGLFGVAALLRRREGSRRFA